MQRGACDPAMENEAFAAFYSRSSRPSGLPGAVLSDPALADDLMQESYVRFLCAAGAPALATDGEAAARFIFSASPPTCCATTGAGRARLPSKRFPKSSSPTRRYGANRVAAFAGAGYATDEARERQMLWLAHAEGYSHREIAQVMA